MNQLTKSIGAAILIFASYNAAAFSETGLTGLLQDLKGAFSWTCSGGACDAVWNEQVRSINALNSYIDNQMPDGISLTKTTGQLARSVADKICRTTMQGPYQTLIWLLNAENRGLTRLAIVQTSAGVNVRTCNKSLR